MITCLKCREKYEDGAPHVCIETMTTPELYSYEAKVLGIQQMLQMHLAPFVGKKLTQARLAALKIEAQVVLEKIAAQDHDDLTPEQCASFEAMVAEAVREIFNPSED